MAVKKKGYCIDLEAATRRNRHFRRVLYTTPNSQLVLMSLRPGQSIGLERHGTDQFFRFEAGRGAVVINGRRHEVGDGSGVVVPAGARHNVTNTSRKERLQLYTLYAPPQHRDGVVRHTKAEAEKKEEHFDGQASE